MDLGHVFGFPLWERAVFRTLHQSFAELHTIFGQHAKASVGTRTRPERPDGEASPETRRLEVMHGAELTRLALDCGLPTEAFPLARVVAACAAADGEPGQGEGGDSGGRGADRALEIHLEVHEFLEALVRLSFLRANPRFGEVAHGHDAPAHPLPECLDEMLTKSILTQSKQTSLGKVQNMPEPHPHPHPNLNPNPTPNPNPNPNPNPTPNPNQVALLKRKAGKDKDADQPKSKNLAMDHQSGDSYAECFPESFEGYTMELGPDSDDEANVVRSKKEEDEPEAEPEAEGEEGGKGGNRKERRKKGPGKEKIEELKQEAKLSRELVQLEKFMEERKKKRDRRDDDGDGGGPPARGSRGADISQNEMF